MKHILPANADRSRVIRNLFDQIERLPADKAWTVVVKKFVRQRTTDQNSRFHAMCTELGNAVGYTCEELKKLVKKELGRYQTIDGPMGRVIRFQSSADWNSVEMSEAIELLHRWAIEAEHVWSVE